MIRYILKRLLMLVPVLLGVTLIVFLMLQITPGNPAEILLGSDATQEAIDQLTEELGLNDPVLVRLWNYIKGVLHGDLGTSYSTKQPVIDEIKVRFPTTLTLAICSTTLSAVIGILLGIASATHQYGWIDKFSTFFALAGVSIPGFWLGLMLIVLFAVKLRILPSSGFSTPIHWILPAVTIGYRSSATVTRQSRSSMLEVIRQDYIRTARAKGQSERVVIYRHALKNALIPVVTVLGMQFGGGLGGAVITETVFSIPGLGKLMIDSINSRNYPMIQGGVLILALSYTLVNLAVDIIYAFLDPRIKAQYSKGSKKSKSKRKEGNA